MHCSATAHGVVRPSRYLRDSQAGEHASAEDEGNGDAQVQPETRVGGRLGQVLIGEGVDGALVEEGYGLHHGCEAVDEGKPGNADGAMTRPRSNISGGS